MSPKIPRDAFQVLLTLALLAGSAFAVTFQGNRTASVVDTDNPCSVPEETRTFLNTAPRAWLWFKVGEVSAGDRLKVEWASPDGAVYHTASWAPLSGGGSWCLWAQLEIAGANAASRPGRWAAQVYYNDVILFNQVFNVLGLSKFSARSVDTGACNPPVATQAFSTDDPRVWLWFLVTGTSRSDRFRIEWDSPDGARYRTASWNPLNSGGSNCFWDQITVAGDAPSSRPGNWEQRVYYNDQLLFSHWFFISLLRFNSTLAFQVGPDGRFNAGAFPDSQTGFDGASSYRIMFGWPGASDTSFTTLRIDGNDSIFGTDGSWIEPPANFDDKSNRSRWRIGDLEVTQLLQLAFNPQTGREDAIKIS